MRDFRKLKVWEKSHALTLTVYKATAVFPQQEMYGVTSQLRRAAASIAANIAEGCGRTSETELARFMQIGMTSASEVAYYLILARDLTYLPPDQFQKLSTQTDEVQRMLRAFIAQLRENKPKPIPTQRLKANS
jgi:four helix bundle protein